MKVEQWLARVDDIRYLNGLDIYLYVLLASDDRQLFMPSLSTKIPVFSSMTENWIAEPFPGWRANLQCL